MIVAATGAPDVDLQARVHAEIREQQFPLDCSGRRLLVVDWIDGSGLGSMVVTVASALAEAYYSNRTVVLGPRQMTYRPDVDSCTDNGYGCYFEPISSCDVVEHASLSELVQWYHEPFNPAIRVKREEERRGNIAILVAPARYRQEHDANRRWAAAMVSFVFRPKAQITAHLAAIRRERRLEPVASQDFVGVHVRHGETSIARMKPKFPTAEYVALASAGTVSTLPLFVASDSVGIEREVHEAVGSLSGTNTTDRRIVILPRLRVTRGCALLEDHGEHCVSGKLAPAHRSLLNQAALEALEDLDVLADAHTLIGTGASHFMVTAVLLRLSRGITRKPLLMDEAQLDEGMLSVGLLHVGNFRASAQLVPGQRWRAIEERFVESVPVDDLRTARQSEGARKGDIAQWDTDVSFPSFDSAVLDSEVGHWRTGIECTSFSGELDEVIALAKSHWRVGKWHLGLSCAKAALHVAQTTGNDDAEAFVLQMIDRYTDPGSSFLFKRESAHVVFLKDSVLKKLPSAQVAAERSAIADKLEGALSNRPHGDELDLVMHDCGKGKQCFENGWGRLVRGDLRGSRSCWKQCMQRSNHTQAMARRVRSSDCSAPIGAVWRLYCAVCFTLHARTEADSAKCARVESTFDVWRFNEEWVHAELQRSEGGPSVLLVPNEPKAECGAAQVIYVDGSLSEALVNFVKESLDSASSQEDALDEFWRRAQHLLHRFAWHAIQTNHTSLLAAHAECGKHLRLVASWFAPLPRTKGVWRSLGSGRGADITVVFFISSTDGVEVRCADGPVWKPKRGAMLLVPRGATCELALANAAATNPADVVAYMSRPSSDLASEGDSEL
jgi:hypothetical protein